MYFFFIVFFIFSVPTVTSGPVVCADKLTNCAAYDKSACQGQYQAWALDNCMKYCGLCKFKY